MYSYTPIFRVDSQSSADDNLFRGFDERSRSELIRDEAVFAAPASPDARLAEAIRDMHEKGPAKLQR